MRITKTKSGFFKSSAKIILALILVLSSLFISVDFAFAKDNPVGGNIHVNGHTCKADEVIVKFSEMQTETDIGITLNALGSNVEKKIQKGLKVVKVPDGETVESFIAELAGIPGVELVQPNYVYQIETTVVNDPIILSNDQWHLAKTDVFEAWDITMGSPDIKVAVIDSGIDQDHEDLIGQIVAQTDIPEGDGIAQDNMGHGTHVSGIIAAAANNAKGGAGVAPGVGLIVVNIFYQNTEGDWEANTSDSITAINYAIGQGADVINMSFGGYGDDTLFRDAINAAVAAGTVCVAAAGNDNTSQAHYPSDYDACISVVSTDYNDLRSSFSNYGSTKDIAAPGSSIVSTYFDGGYAYMSGTSMASPVVAGVVALMLSANPALTVDEVKQILYSTAVDLGTAGKDDFYANGRVDAAQAVASAAALCRVSSVSLNKHTVEMSTNGHEQLTPTILPETALDKAVTWASDDNSVVMVTDDGYVYSTGVGTATVTVTTNDGGYTDTCTFNVYKGAQSVSLNVHEASITAGDTTTLYAVVEPSDSVNKTVTWSSSNTSIATVSSSGTVTGISGGTALFTAKTDDGGFTDSCTVNVTPVNIESTAYTINQVFGTISGVYEKTSVDSFKANLINEPGEIFIYNADGTFFTGTAVGTGMKVCRVASNGIITDELTIIVKGDCSGDGAISIADYTMIRLDILDLKALSGVFTLAADVNPDNNISIADYTLIRLHILELKRLT
jgi:hypothetical protein